MPFAAIEITNLFCGHRVSHCFDECVFIYKTFYKKSTSWEGLEPPTNSLEVRCSNPTELPRHKTIIPL